MQSCEIPKVLPYQTLMSYIRNIDLSEVLNFEILAEKLSTESVPGVYRPLKPFLLGLADMYLTLHEKDPCLLWYNGSCMWPWGQMLHHLVRTILPLRTWSVS